VMKVLTSHQRWFEEAPATEPSRAYQVLQSLLRDDEAQRFLGVNRHQDVLWFNRDAFEELLWWMMVAAVVEATRDAGRPAVEVADEIVDGYEVVQALRRAEQESEYRVEKLLEMAKH